MYFDYHFEINRRLSDAVEGALQVADIPGHYMGVDLRGLDIRVYHLRNVCITLSQSLRGAQATWQSD